jgi:phosphomannomutase
MRRLNQQYKGENVVTIDGFKIGLTDEEWVHIGPNSDMPYVEISAEAADTERATRLVHEYAEQVRLLIGSIATKEDAEL